MKYSKVLAVYTALLLVFVYVPIAVLIVQSFNASRYAGAWRGFTLKWYAELVRDREVITATLNGLAVATLSAAISTLLGGFAGYYFSRVRYSRTVDSLLYIPIVIPEIVESVSLLMLFYYAGVELGFTTVLIGHVAYNIAYAYVAVKPQFILTPRSVEDAALNLGAKPLDVFVKVLLPMAAPGVASSLIITFTMSFDDFVKTSFTTGPGFKTLPLVIWVRAARARATPELNALATIMIIFSMVSSYIYTRYVLSRR